MKQYTTPEQTAKLIELGFERPFRNEYLYIVEEYGYAVNKERNFSIGELIEILDNQGIIVNPVWILDSKNELIDDLYNTIITWKKHEYDTRRASHTNE